MGIILMASINKLRQKLNNVDSEMKKNIGHLGTMAKDAERVSIVDFTPLRLHG
jgi:hypothetical protein